MKVFDKYDKIEEVKLKIIDSSLLVSLVVGFIAYILSLLKYPSQGFQITYISDLSILLVFLLLLFKKNTISIKSKVFVILIGLLILIFTDIYKFGFYSNNKIFLILIPFFSVLAFSVRKIIFVYIFAIIIIFFLGYLHFKGILNLPTNYKINLNVWIVNILLISIVAYIFLLITVQFNSTYEKLIKVLINSNKEIRENHQNYREIFNASSDAIFLSTLGGRVLDVNKAALILYQFDKDELNNMQITNFSEGNPPYDKVAAKLHIQIAIDKGTHTFDWYARKKTGELFWAEVVLRKAQIGGKERLLAIVRDIHEKKQVQLELREYRTKLEEIVKTRTEELTKANNELKMTNNELYSQREELTSILEELKRTQNHLIHSEKMASLGVLAAGVAHEINNPLNFIQGGVDALDSFFEDEKIESKDMKFIFDTIKKGVARAASIVMSLNHFSRQVPHSNEICDIHAIIDNCLIMLDSAFKNKITLTKKYCSDHFKIVGNEGKLHQVMINVLKNAEQAIDGQGKISIETKVAADFLNIIISDTGCGITEENIDKITDPFYTTKPPGQGTGLGLSISYNIIKEHGGDLIYQSEKESGTIATIRLPLSLSEESMEQNY